MNNGSKISDEQFLSVLMENGGLYAMTARAIETQFDIAYSRQAVRDRALKHPDTLEDIKEENLDTAEAGLYSLMRSTDDRIKFGAIAFYLKNKAKRRGYSEREVLGEGDNELRIYVEERLMS